MPLPFDATLKDLVQSYPRDWAAVLGAPSSAPVSVLTPDLSTLSAFADLVLRCGDCLFHLDVQSGPDAGLARRMLLYNVLLHERYALPVHTVVMLLRPRADRSDLTGVLSYQARPERGGVEFRFEVVRIWQIPVETLLAGSLGTLPLAPLGQLPEGAGLEEAMPGVIQRLVERIMQEAPPEQGPKLLTGAFVLPGARMSREVVHRYFQGVRGMRDSDTYQAILEEGRVEEAQKLLLRLGRKRFGEPTSTIETALRAIIDLDRLERMGDQILVVHSWPELLGTR